MLENDESLFVWGINSIIEVGESVKVIFEEAAPFVVIGRLQKDKYIGYDKYQNYKVKYRFN